MEKSPRNFILRALKSLLLWACLVASLPCLSIQRLLPTFDRLTFPYYMRWMDVQDLLFCCNIIAVNVGIAMYYPSDVKHSPFAF